MWECTRIYKLGKADSGGRRDQSNGIRRKWRGMNLYKVWACSVLSKGEKLSMFLHL